MTTLRTPCLPQRRTNAELAERNEELQNTLQDVTREREAAAKELEAAKVATAKAHADLQQSKGMAGRWVQRYKEQQNNLLNAQEALTQSTKDELERVRAAVKAEKKSEVDKIHRMIKSLKDGSFSPTAWGQVRYLMSRRRSIAGCRIGTAPSRRARTTQGAPPRLPGRKR